MNIEDIEMADCLIEKTEKNGNKISFLFSELYDTKKNEYVTDKTLIIKDWTHFIVKLNIMNKSFPEGKEKILSEAEFEMFDEISRKTINDNKLILEGFSKYSGHWMVYEFTDYRYEVIDNSLI